MGRSETYSIFASIMNFFLVLSLGLLILIKAGSGLKCYIGSNHLMGRELLISELDESTCDGACIKLQEFFSDDQLKADIRRCSDDPERIFGCRRVHASEDGVKKNYLKCWCSTDLCNGHSGSFPCTLFIIAALLILRTIIE